MTETIRQKHDRKYKEWSEKNSALIREKRDHVHAMDKYREKKSKHDAEVKKWEKDQDTLNQKIDGTNRRSIEYNERYGGRMLTMSELALAKKIIADIEKDEAPFPKEKARITNEHDRLEIQAEKLHSEELDNEEKTRQLNLQEELIIKEKKELDEQLSGKHWVEKAFTKWKDSKDAWALDKNFANKLSKFQEMLKANGIKIEITSTKRDVQISYLYHFCVAIAKGEVKAKDVDNGITDKPRPADVDIIWNHEKDIDAAKEMKEGFNLGDAAAHPSNHNGGKAVDMKFDFSGFKNEKKEIKYKHPDTNEEKIRPIKIDDEATVGVKASGKAISNIEDRELSKAGADFGLYRKIDTDIVHWSDDGT